MQTVCNKLNSLFFPQVSYEETLGQSITKLVQDTLRAGACFGALLAPAGAYSVSKIAGHGQRPLVVGAAIFAGCIVVAALVALVRSACLFIHYKKNEAEVESKIKEELAANTKTEEKKLEALDQQWASAYKSWTSSKEIDPLLKLCSDQAPAYLPADCESDVQLLEQTIKNNWAMRDAFIEARDDSPQKIIQIYQVMIKVGCEYLHIAEKLQKKQKLKSDYYYAAAATWLIIPGKALYTWIQDQSLPFPEHEFVSCRKDLLKATALYWYMITNDKITFEDDEDRACMEDSLSKAVEHNDPMAKFAQACWKLKNRNADEEIPPQVKVEIKDTLRSFGTPTKEGKPDSDITYEGISISDLARRKMTVPQEE